MKTLIAALIGFLIPLPLVAQTSSTAQQVTAGRAIHLPDTLGARVVVADSLKSLGTISDYDALIGTWEFTFQPRQSDGSFRSPFTGHWTFEKKGDALIEDHFRPDDPTTPMTTRLYTFRIFDPSQKVWRLVGTHSYWGGFRPGRTWADSDGRSGVEWQGDVLVRFRYFALTADHFLWRQDKSADGGKTWLLDAGTMDAHRIGK